MALTERDFTFDGDFYPVERPTTIATRPLQDRLPVWPGGSSKETMRLAAVRGRNVMRNFGSNQEHRDALEDYIKVAAENGHARSGANMMIERFVAIGETEDRAERNLGSLIEAFGQFLTLYAAGGGRPIPETDGEFRVEHGTARKNRPAIAVSGTPEQIADALQQVIDETGARTAARRDLLPRGGALVRSRGDPGAERAECDSSLAAARGRVPGGDEQLGQLARGGGVLRGFVVAPASGEPREAHGESGIVSDLAPGGGVVRGQGQLGAQDFQDKTRLEPDVRLLASVDPGGLVRAQERR